MSSLVVTDTLKVCKHCDSILDERWWKAMYEVQLTVLKIYDRNGTLEEKRLQFELLKKELDRLQSLPREKQ